MRNLPVLKGVVKALFSKFSSTLFSVGSKASSIAVPVGFMIPAPINLRVKNFLQICMFLL